MKKVILILIVVFSFSGDILSQDVSSPLKIEVVGTEECNGCRDRSTYDTRIIFRVTNVSGKSLYLFGDLTGEIIDPEKFTPLITLIRFDNSTKEWRYPTRDGQRPKWEHLSNEYKETFKLKPREYVDFDAIMSAEIEANKPFKMALYVSNKKTPEPTEILSEELMFTVKTKNKNVK